VPESIPERLGVFFGPGSGVEICEIPDPESLLFFGSIRSLRSLYKCRCLSTNNAEFRLHRLLPESEPESDSQICEKFGSEPGLKNFEMGTESVPDSVAPATSGQW